MHPASARAYLRRAPWCLLPLVVGVGAALIVLLTARGPLPSARAAPDSLSYPGCGATIQACLNAAAPGDTVVLQPGTYITSVAIGNAVNLSGANSATTILQALPGQRAIYVAGPAIYPSVTISGLTVMGGSALGATCQTACGGGILVTGTMNASIVNVRLVGNIAGFAGGAVFANNTLSLTGVEVISNTAQTAGGGVFSRQTLYVLGGRFERNVAAGSGGGLVGNSTTTIVGTLFLSNTAASGGGASVYSGLVQSALFQANTCTQPSTCLGGGLYADWLNLQGGLFQGNSNGVFLGQSGELSGTWFINNAGVGLQLGWPAVPSNNHRQITNVLFAGAAPGLVVVNGGEVAVLHTTFAYPTPSADAAIIILSGTVGITNSIIANHSVGISLTAGTAWESHNLFFANGTDLAGAVTQAGGSQNGDPAFRNPGVGDYHLLPGSAAIDIGPDAGVPIDADGQPRPLGNSFDAGFDEFLDLPLKLFVPLTRR
jgi:hypothetical protein